MANANVGDLLTAVLDLDLNDSVPQCSNEVTVLNERTASLKEDAASNATMRFLGSDRDTKYYVDTSAGFKVVNADGADVLKDREGDHGQAPEGDEKEKVIWAIKTLDLDMVSFSLMEDLGIIQTPEEKQEVQPEAPAPEIPHKEENNPSMGEPNPGAEGAGVEKPMESVQDEKHLTAADRKSLPKSDFAIKPDRYPIEDEAHAKAALARVEANGTPEEKAKVRAAVKAKYPHMEVSHTHEGKVPSIGKDDEAEMMKALTEMSGTPSDPRDDKLQPENPVVKKEEDKAPLIEKSNTDVIDMYIRDTFPKDKMPVWGTANLKITKMDNGWALVNYYTPILYRANGSTEVLFNTQKYSPTTSKIQNQIRSAAQAAGVSLTDSNESGIRTATAGAEEPAEEPVAAAAKPVTTPAEAQEPLTPEEGNRSLSI